MQLRDEHDRVHLGRKDLVVVLGGQLATDVVVVPVDPLHQGEEAAHRDNADPSAGQELGQQDDHEDRQSHAEAERVDGA